MNITVDQQQDNREAIIKVSGEIDAYTAPKLREVLFPLSEMKQTTMIVNLEEVSYMDSTGLGVFVGVLKNVRAKNGDLKLIGLSERLLRLFDITGLADIITIQSKIEGGV